MNANDVILDYKQILRHLISDYILIFSSPRIMLLQSHVFPTVFSNNKHKTI